MAFGESEPRTEISPVTNGHNGHLEGSINLPGLRKLTLARDSQDGLQVEETGAEESSFASFLRELPAVLTREQQMYESMRIFIGQIALQRLASLAGSDLLSDDQRQRVEGVAGNNLSKFLLKHFDLQTAMDKKKSSQSGEERLSDIAKREARWQLKMGMAAGMQSPERTAHIDRIIESQKALVFGGQKSFNKMCETNLRLCVHVAKFAYKKVRDNGKNVEFKDLVGYGTEGLMIAVVRYDFRKRLRFSTYASHWVLQKIQRGLEESASLVRVPKEVEDRLKETRVIGRRLTQELGRLPTFEELAEEGHDWELARISLLEQTVSLNQSVGLSGDAELGDLILDQDGQTAQDSAEIAELRRALLGAMTILDKKERQIILLRFGLVDSKPRTLPEIGRIIGISRERVRQIEAKAFDKLRLTPALVELSRF